MKILWHSNAPWAPTGYGQQTREVVTRLKADGHDAAISCFFGLYGATQDWGDILCYPGGADVFGNDVITAHALHHFGSDTRAGWLFTLMDVWTLIAPTLREFNVASWVPIDHDPAPPATVDYFRRTGALPVAMSQFGRDKLTEAGLSPVYIPHAIDTEVFRPFDRAAARKVVAELGLVQNGRGEHVAIPADAFVVGMNAANKGTTPPRKAFPQVFEAFARFATKHSDAVLYLHTEQLGTFQGAKLLELAAGMGIADRTFWTDQYAYRIGIMQEHVSLIYSSMNVLANPAFGEGFGIPIIEAQACGVPVIVNGFSSMPELCGAGWQTTGDRFWHEGQFSWYQIPSINSIFKAMESAYQKGDRWRNKAREFAVNYDSDKVYAEYWRPLLAQMEQQIGLVDVGPVPAVGEVAP